MGKMGNVERVMEKWAADLVDRVFRPKRESVEVVSTLRRECDDNIMILGRGRTLVPNAFTVALLRRAIVNSARTYTGWGRCWPRRCEITPPRTATSSPDR